ncbi:Failed axon connections-like [Mizuhopecten yessoensis]|uniref:Failed axon connections-like n=1 Tax=Mizuhopecten yessoensis TaxID=6573 RepID=A0A210QVJ3_MIZYE|nr:Failed axon connections-like [Mizuhopecten yessoensis]
MATVIPGKTLVLDRWVYDKTEEIYNVLRIPWFVRWRVRSSIKNMAYSHGIGRHSKEEVYEILRTDLQALSNVLGVKRFLMGSRPCQHDCAVFGMLAEIMWEPFGGFTHAILCEFPNLVRYCENMKEDVWPDWDECTTKRKSASPQS